VLVLLILILFHSLSQSSSW